MTIERHAPEESRPLFPYVRRQTYREAHTPSKEQQAQRLEAMRYRTYSQHSLRQRVMQRLGDWGRRVLGWVS